MADATAASATATSGTKSGFTAEERAAMRERAKELKASETRAEAEKAVLEKIAGMSDGDRVMAERVHAIVTAAAPELASRLWYGSPAYAKDGTIICFFQESTKFKIRYATLGFSDAAKLDDGTMWPTSFALTELTAADEERISELVKRAVR
ncbi:DUF1801 domain-containing protein [Rathayibacter sp. YIM 133350]|uniref:iron chaperone n=1 Tax=Rathayibacter sp. YIM 133350 TaxID=3131992 RepID=UPI00307F0EAB